MYMDHVFLCRISCTFGIVINKSVKKKKALRWANENSVPASAYSSYVCLKHRFAGGRFYLADMLIR